MTVTDWLATHPRTTAVVGLVVLTGGLWATVLLGTEGG